MTHRLNCYGETLIRRRPNNRGTFVVFGTDINNGENVVIKASTDAREFKIIQELDKLNFQHVPRIYYDGELL